MSHSLGYVGQGQKFSTIEVEGIESVSGGGSDLLIDGRSKSVQIHSNEAVADAIELKNNNVAGGVSISAGTSGLSLSSTGQTFISGATFRGAAITGDQELSVTQSGTTFMWDASGTDTLTLPPAVPGLTFKIVLLANSTADVEIITTLNAPEFYGTITSGGQNSALIAQESIVGVKTTGGGFLGGDSISIDGIAEGQYLINVLSSNPQAGGFTYS